MKPSIPLLLFMLCSFVITIMASFQVGAIHGAKPYRALVASIPDSLALTQIGVQQSQTLLLVSSTCVGLSLLGLGCFLFYLYRRKEPVHLLQPPAPTHGNEA